MIKLQPMKLANSMTPLTREPKTRATVLGFHLARERGQQLVELHPGLSHHCLQHRAQVGLLGTAHISNICNQYALCAE